MGVIAPSVTAYSPDEYRQQIEKVAKFAERIHIDLMDGQFTKERNITPDEAWWPVGVKADFHLMYKNPHQAAEIILEHRPNMIIAHSESSGSFSSLAAMCRRAGVRVGIALLPHTPPEAILPALPEIDHVLIFSGDLGSFGGRANFDLLNKIDILRHHKPDLEIGWDGGVSQQNISQLAFGGVDVFDVGGFIQQAEDPEKAFHILARIADETGTT
jgi:ribulose-phosphate 3-epimerase